MFWVCTNKGHIGLSPEEVVNTLLHMESGLIILAGSSGERIIQELAQKSTNRRIVQISALGAVDCLVESLYSFRSLGDADLCSRAVEEDIYCLYGTDTLQCMKNSQRILSSVIGYLKDTHLIILCGKNMRDHFDDLLLVLSFSNKFFYFLEENVLG